MAAAFTVETVETWEMRMLIANIHGLKKQPVSSIGNLLNYTHFLLPAFESRLTGHDIQPFIDFWLQVDDIHKERRMLVNWVCGKECFKEIEKDEPEQYLKILAVYVKTYTKCMSECFWIMRQLFIADQRRSRRFFHVVKRFSTTLPKSNYMSVDIIRKFWKEFFEEPVESACFQLKMPKVIIFSPICKALAATFDAFTDMDAGWMAAKSSNSTKKYLKKLRVAVPHWRVEDRAYILEALKEWTDEERSSGSYVHKLIDDVGMERFKEIAFGKEKFCSSCGKSSYTAQDRLWSCKRCVRERVRPKARYCNADCQKAHWIQHRAEIHATPSCAKCGYKKTVSGSDSLITCKFCISEDRRWPAYYCSEFCQTVHWPGHRSQMHAQLKIDS